LRETKEDWAKKKEKHLESLWDECQRLKNFGKGSGQRFEAYTFKEKLKALILCLE